MGTPAVPTAPRRPPARKEETQRTRPGVVLGTRRTKTFVANVRGRVHSPARKRSRASVNEAEAKTSAGAPRRICVSRAFEPAKLNDGSESMARKAPRSEAAA